MPLEPDEEEVEVPDDPEELDDAPDEPELDDEVPDEPDELDEPDAPEEDAPELDDELDDVPELDDELHAVTMANQPAMMAKGMATRFMAEDMTRPRTVWQPRTRRSSMRGFH